jgi:hypothetical protein
MVRQLNSRRQSNGLFNDLDEYAFLEAANGDSLACWEAVRLILEYSVDRDMAMNYWEGVQEAVLTREEIKRGIAHGLVGNYTVGSRNINILTMEGFVVRCLFNYFADISDDTHQVHLLQLTFKPRMEWKAVAFRAFSIQPGEIGENEDVVSVIPMQQDFFMRELDMRLLEHRMLARYPDLMIASQVHDCIFRNDVIYVAGYNLHSIAGGAPLFRDQQDRHCLFLDVGMYRKAPSRQYEEKEFLRQLAKATTGFGAAPRDRVIESCTGPFGDTAVSERMRMLIELLAAAETGHELCFRIGNASDEKIEALSRFLQTVTNYPPELVLSTLLNFVLPRLRAVEGDIDEEIEEEYFLSILAEQGKMKIMKERRKIDEWGKAKGKHKKKEAGKGKARWKKKEKSKGKKEKRKESKQEREERRLHAKRRATEPESDNDDEGEEEFLVPSRPPKFTGIEDLMNHSVHFEQTVLGGRPFPLKVNRIESLLRVPGHTAQAVEVQARSVRILAHVQAIAMMTRFLDYKRGHGTSLERALYAQLDLHGLVDRLLQKRPLIFVGPKDRTMLRGQSRAKIAHRQWLRVGKANEIGPFLLGDYLSYEEMELSALLSVACPTYFINDGNRCNRGKPGKPGTFQREGVLIGAVGPRLEVPGVMERKYMEARPHKASSRDEMLRHWRHLYGLDDPKHPEGDLDLPGFVIDRHAYGVRMRLTLEPLILFAAEAGRRKGMLAVLRLVGLGLGQWRVSSELAQAIAMLEVVLAVVDENGLGGLGRIEFLSFDGLEVPASVADANGHRIAMSACSRAPAEPLDPGELLVATYDWDANSLPGNEFWAGGSFAASQASAAAACSTIQELANPLVNTALRSATKLLPFGRYNYN